MTTEPILTERLTLRSTREADGPCAGANRRI